MQAVPPVPERVPLAVPSYRGEVAPQPAERRKAFVAYLRRIVWEASEAPLPRTARKPAPPLSAAQHDLAAWACTACGGECCSRGGTHAYLDDDTIGTVARAHPHLGRRGLADLYLRHLPAEAFAGSCVFHAADGCALPRDLRSDLCNTFYCTALKQFFREHPEATGRDVAVTAEPRPSLQDTRQRRTLPRGAATGAP